MNIMVIFEQKGENTYTLIGCANYNASKKDFIEEIFSLGNGVYKIESPNNDEDFSGIWIVHEDLLTKVDNL